jgi:hypothetical protein
MPQPRQRRVIQDPEEVGPNGKCAPWRRLPKVEKTRKIKGKGRPSKMSGAVLLQIETVCKVGGRPSYRSIAEFIGVDHKTFHRWLDEFIDLRQRIDQWRQQGLFTLRKKGWALAKDGDGRMIRYYLDRLEPDFSPNSSAGDASAEDSMIEDDETPDPTWL